MENARRERAARGAARQHVKAAVTVQAAYRPVHVAVKFGTLPCDGFDRQNHA